MPDSSFHTYIPYLHLNSLEDPDQSQEAKAGCRAGPHHSVTYSLSTDIHAHIGPYRPPLNTVLRLICAVELAQAWCYAATWSSPRVSGHCPDSGE